MILDGLDRTRALQAQYGAEVLPSKTVTDAEAAREAAIHDMVYTAETRVIEWEDSARQQVKSETLSVRRVYVRAPDQMHNEYLSMTIDGRELNRKEMERELAKQRRGGRRAQVHL